MTPKINIYNKLIPVFIVRTHGIVKKQNTNTYLTRLCIKLKALRHTSKQIIIVQK